MHLFAIILDYVSDMASVDAVRGDHLQYIKPFQNQGIFLLSGPQAPRTGGFILAQGENKAFFENIMDHDPFILNGVAKYRVVVADITHCIDPIMAAIIDNKTEHFDAPKN